jgi:hypothetical protein
MISCDTTSAVKCDTHCSLLLGPVVQHDLSLEGRKGILPCLSALPSLPNLDALKGDRRVWLER